MILQTMLNRLHASLVHGPSMNARPHRSRQRIDFLELAAFQGRELQGLLAELLEKGSVELPAKAPRFEPPELPEAEWSPEQKEARTAYDRQRKLLEKLRSIAVDAQDYFNDHGESALGLGFPVLALPPVETGRGGAASGRILAPLAFVPLEMQVRQGSRPGVTLRCLGEGADLLVLNPALLAYLEQQTGESIEALFTDDDGADPWREVAEALAYITRATKLEPAPVFTPETLLAPVPETAELPKTAALLPSAVLGLFPLMNQALLRDTQWMLEREGEMGGPVASFLRQEALAPEVAEELPEAEAFTVEQQAAVTRQFGEEWLVTQADPCQSEAVRAARSSRALVVHGPPGTGKSQTIANIIGDHLARGERVLFVCDKRTALDVVKYRLDALGLGHLCGVVHDPTLDRRALYMHFRTQLESLAESEVAANPEPQLRQVNCRLQELHQELSSYRASLHLAGADGKSFHDLLGAWLELTGDVSLPTVQPVPELRPEQVETHRTSLDEILRRAARAGYAANPFRNRLGIALSDYLARDPAAWQAQLIELSRVSDHADALRPDDAMPLGDASLPAQAAAFRKAADVLRRLVAAGVGNVCKIVSGSSPEQLRAWQQESQGAEEWARALETGPLERELELAVKGTPLGLGVLNQRIAALETWLPLASSFRRFFAFGAKGEARAALTPLGLPMDTAGTGRALSFYRGLRARTLLSDLAHRVSGAEDAGAAWSDADLRRTYGGLRDVLEFQLLAAEPTLAQAGDRLLTVLTDLVAHGESTVATLRASAPWAEALEAALTAATATGLFRAEALGHFRMEGAGGRAGALASAWLTAHPQLEEMVRIEASLAALPVFLRPPVDQFAAEGVDLVDALAALRRVGLENALRERVRTDAALAAVDGDRIEAAFATFADLSAQKQELVRAHVRHLWLARQRKRLVAMTGSQLSKQGAALRQRLFVKGKRALKLRQMIATGADTEGGDPLYDLCPVWMASPSTVAQVFPREPYFQVVVFDEASQCRLEEALPVLLRGHRVVVAGDPKQLPPTRFFETAVADTGDTDAETGEELFQQQQSEAEDLLSAALNLDVHEAFLDVHYRSRNEALIGFSNQTFYHDRLQPIPGHPKNRALRAPILLHRVDGVYRDRTNPQEAERAADLVAELLSAKEPPSIGVACFNLTQRDEILKALDARAQQDPEFARRLDEARKRRGRDSFEGLFVKNLENVQGDERDVMIISTTFGLDEHGKFRRNFGALSRQEGGRRLNVLVTRARSAIHVLTSIPRSEYHAPEPVEEGLQPTGRHHLYSYLRYAEQLHTTFEQYSDSLEKLERDHIPQCDVLETPTPSPVAVALARELHQRHAIGSTVHWGNEGFCVDAALTHPEMPVDVTLGILTDFTRFRKTPDPIEWDLFRTNVLRGQGWELARLWSPALFRRGEQIIERIAQQHHRSVDAFAAAQEEGKDAQP